jgi:hypothetical protein
MDPAGRPGEELQELLEELEERVAVGADLRSAPRP